MNPYQSPKTTLVASSPRPSPIWWGYWAISVLLAVFAFAMLLHTNDNFSGYKLLAFATGSVDLIALVGLSFYIRSKPIFSNVLWRMILGILVVKFVAPTIGLIENAIAFSGPEQRVALFACMGWLWGLPLIYAIWRYAFSHQLWRTHDVAA
jgi:hypothetical protein